MGNKEKSLVAYFGSEKVTILENVEPEVASNVKSAIESCYSVPLEIEEAEEIENNK